MKKILLLFVALLTLSVTAYAQRIQVFVDGDWAYYINPFAEHEVTVIEYQGKEESEATELTIPSYATYRGSRYFVTVLGEGLFSKFNNVGNYEYTHEWQHEAFTKLEKVTIPNTVTDIEDRVFDGCISLTSVNIPNSVTDIKGWAFRDCSSLTSVTIPNSVTRIYTTAFRGCESLQGIEVEEGNSRYKSVDGVLYNFDLTELHTYPGGKKGAFEIPNSVTDIGDFAFYGCSSLTSVNIPNSVRSYGDELDQGYVFEGCTSLTSVNLPNSVGHIPDGLFKGCTSLTSVNIPNSVKRISNDAFGGCTSLTSVTIPDAVEYLGNYSFDGCTSLTTIYALPTTPPECGSDPFRNVPKTAVVYIPKGSFKGYFVAKGWDHFTDYREMGAFDITLSESTISIEEGKTATLTATVTKDNDVTVASETWASSNPEVATVDGGVVTAVAEGTATITYTVVDSYGCPHTEYCEVTVSANTAIDDITVNGSDAPVEYYNLNGIRVNADHLTPGLYIKRQGTKATKVLVK